MSSRTRVLLDLLAFMHLLLHVGRRIGLDGGKSGNGQRELILPKSAFYDGGLLSCEGSD